MYSVTRYFYLQPCERVTTYCHSNEQLDDKNQLYVFYVMVMKYHYVM